MCLKAQKVNLWFLHVYCWSMINNLVVKFNSLCRHTNMKSAIEGPNINFSGVTIFPQRMRLIWNWWKTRTVNSKSQIQDSEKVFRWNPNNCNKIWTFNLNKKKSPSNFIKNLLVFGLNPPTGDERWSKVSCNSKYCHIHTLLIFILTLALWFYFQFACLLCTVCCKSQKTIR